jgi:hypothetical protein
VLHRAILLLLLAAACKGGTAPAAAPAARSCLDVQLAAKALNEYGDPAGTMYPGGTPLFDEKTGRRISRENYVFEKHPDIARACRADAGA